MKKSSKGMKEMKNGMSGGIKEVEEMKSIFSSLKEALGNLKISADIIMVEQGTVNNGDNIKGEGDVQDGAWSFDLEIETKLGEDSTAYMLMEEG